MLAGTLTLPVFMKSAAVFASFFFVHTAWKFASPCPCSKRVKVTVCTEALCPGCKEFVLNELMSTFTKLSSDVIDLELIPYGNAMLKNQTAVCQHGIGECDANTFEQCMIHSFPDPNVYLPMLECLEQSLPMGSHDEKFDIGIFEDCASQANLEFARIRACHDDPRTAWKVLQKAAKATPSDHKYVPWVVVDDKHMDEEHDELLDEVCKAYVAKGGSHPACKSTMLLESS